MAIQLEETGSADSIKVLGRGELQLAILIEQMRREGFELTVSRPEVVMREIDGEKHEPFEEVILDIPDDIAWILRVSTALLMRIIESGKAHDWPFQIEDVADVSNFIIVGNTWMRLTDEQKRKKEPERMTHRNFTYHFEVIFVYPVFAHVRYNTNK